jgi:hypothetical protein
MMGYQWEYLRNRIMISRYALADYFLQYCTDIIEIGGMGDFINSSSFNSVVVCDPLCTLESTSNITYVKNLFERVDWGVYLDKDDAIIGLCIVGVGDGLNLNAGGLSVMKRIVEKVDMVALEVAVDHEPSMNDFERISEFCKNGNVVADFEIDYSRSISKIGDLEERVKRNVDTFLRRRMVILENKLPGREGGVPPGNLEG